MSPSCPRINLGYDTLPRCVGYSSYFVGSRCHAPYAGGGKKKEKDHEPKFSFWPGQANGPGPSWTPDASCSILLEMEMGEVQDKRTLKINPDKVVSRQNKDHMLCIQFGSVSNGPKLSGPNFQA